ncbi:uncharacterized protein HMPREF1541_04233 [Cyphellophora europaea CBS 101466]|uniref:F-box domain-containing protein n=1 Tax=Cyphellophora europaea (strain CBS 101466) TaxID=1220924 RepID=W2S0T9_CYPE1|nr:uncharacterized protein HMPREF1541_04233 [Cyphellophora europaea CBS 101466]ETN42292.1 hypothetical protein HMPREF1541_04233 [Cyphellophora europaea CBS 101466]
MYDHPRAGSAGQPHRDPPTPYNISVLGGAGGSFAPSLPSLVPGSILIGRAEFIPLNLIAHILTFIEDDAASLAALCATSRVLYYMALPVLWKRVHLQSFNGVRSRKRNRDGEFKETPEGMGGASPFSVALNALVTHPNAGKHVRSLGLEGEYGEGDAELERCSRAGRVSENAMMLNICVRAALDRCTELQSFYWKLQTRLLPTTYQGLARLKDLKSLHVRFPSSRAPQPTCEIPTMPHLKRLVVTDYDPLCYPDDISKMIFEAQDLEELQLHFSPRMRDAGEPSVQLSHIVRRNIMADRKMKLKRVGVYNLYGKPETELLLRACDVSLVEEFTSINCFGKDEDETGALQTNFTDQAWVEGPYELFPLMKMWRVDQLHRGHAKSFLHRKGLERIYLLNARHGQPPDYESPTGPDSSTDGSATDSSRTSTPISGSMRSSSLKDLYLDTICKAAGDTLKHLIFPFKWSMSAAMIAKLIRSCPSLTQLSACIECNDVKVWKLLMPFLKQLRALRVKMVSEPGCSDTPPNLPWQNSDDLTEELSKLLANGGYDTLRYIGIGDMVWEAVGWEEKIEKVPICDNGEQFKEESVRRRKVNKVSREHVKDVAIWKYDTLDVI